MNRKQIERVLDVGIALSSEKDHFRLLDTIVREARYVTRADAGTLFLIADRQLHFTIIHNDTLGIHRGQTDEPIELPPVALNRKSVAALAALERRSINIADVYTNVDFDLTGPQKYDALTGYHTRSMLVVPLEDHYGDIIGVLQLINAQDTAGEVIAFSEDLERVVASLASQAAVSLTNMQYLAEIDRLFHSFVEVLSTAIDARTPYNVNHTRHIAELAAAFAAYLDQTTTGPFKDCRFDKDRIAQLTMAAWLHDIGKVAIPLRIMDKETRLGDRLPVVLSRLDVIALQAELEACRQDCDPANALDLVEQARTLIEHANNPATFVDPPLAQEIDAIAGRVYKGRDGKEYPWLTPEEHTALRVQRGTLTADERDLIESHVVIGERMLSKIDFSRQYKDVPRWAVQHHEYLDGSGYARGLTADALPLESRLLTILDIFESLTAEDRPYKKALAPERALSILHSMAEEGKLDKNLLQAFADSGIWKMGGKEG